MVNFLMTLEVMVINLSKEDGKDQVSIQLRTTPDPGYHVGK